MTKIAFVGSRKLSDYEHDSRVFFNLALFAAKNNVTMRSGGATGADLIAEKAYDYAIKNYNVNEKLVEIFHAWKSFGKGNPLYHLYKIPPETKERENILQEILEPRHFNILKNGKSKGGILLHSRNVNQVLGENLDDHVDALICWTESGKPEGGTRTAILLGQSRNIPVFNTRFYKKEDYLKLKERILKNEFRN